MAHSTVIPDQLLLLMKSAHLQRLARFALIDGVPAPWVGRTKRPDVSVAAADTHEEG